MPNAPSFTLGWELEACRAAANVPVHVLAERDGSVSGDGREYKIDVTAAHVPSQSLRALRELASDPALHVNRTCGFHVHVGISGRLSAAKRKQWAAAFVLLARAVEPFAFNAVPPSRRANHFCRPWREDSGSVIQRPYRSHKYGNDSRYQWVNVVEAFRPGGIGTVEIRLLGSTKRYAYLFAWSAVCHLMAAAAWRLLSDPSALPSETAVLKTAFDCIARDLLNGRSAHAAAEVAANLAERAGFIGLQELDACREDLESLCRNSRPTADETAETRLTESQALIDAYRLDETAAHAEAISMQPRTVRVRRPRRAPVEVLPTLATDWPQGFNPDAFVAVPTNSNGGGR